MIKEFVTVAGITDVAEERLSVCDSRRLFPSGSSFLPFHQITGRLSRVPIFIPSLTLNLMLTLVLALALILTSTLTLDPLLP